jgi:hypothetical protein
LGHYKQEIGRNLNRMEINLLKIGSTKLNNKQAIAQEFNKEKARTVNMSRNFSTALEH